MVTPERPGRGDLRRELRALILEAAPDLPADVGDDAPLISSGLVESTTLVSLALWVEDRLGREIELGSFDLVVEWDSLNGVLDFVERHRAAATTDGSRR
jgi:hypothetical protein